MWDYCRKKNTKEFVVTVCLLVNCMHDNEGLDCKEHWVT